MYYFVLIAICLIAFIAAWHLEGKTLGSPGTLLTLSLGLGVMLALAGTGSWNNWTDLSNTIALVFCLGFSGFLFAGCFVRTFFVHSDRPLRSSGSSTQSELLIPSFSKRMTLTLILVGLVLSLFWYIGISGIVGISDFSALAGYMKEGTEQRVETSILTLVRVYTRALCMLAALMFVGSIRNGEKRREAFLFLILFLANALPSAVVGMRTELGHVIAGALVAYIILSALRRRDDGVIHLKGLLIAVILCPLIIQLFSLVVELTGRSTTTLTPWEYFTYYLGASVPDFDRFISVFNDASGLSETFNGLQGLLASFGVIEEAGIPAGQHWVQAGLNDLCNTYTIFRPAFHDFGFIGVPVYFFCLGLIFYGLYYRAVRGNSPMAFIVYSYLSFILIDAVRDDFFSTWLGSWGLINLAVILLFFRYCLNSRTRQKVNEKPKIMRNNQSDIFKSDSAFCERNKVRED